MSRWIIIIIFKLQAKSKYHWWLEVRVFVVYPQPMMRFSRYCLSVFSKLHVLHKSSYMLR